jgi:hypothetical protein
MRVIKVTMAEWLEIIKFENEGGHPVDIIYEIIEETEENNIPSEED